MSVLSSWTSEWLPAETIRVWGLTLGHFLWEGLALALLLFCAMRFCRRPQTRYVLAVFTLGAMLIAPFLTFSVLSQTPQTLVRTVTIPGSKQNFEALQLLVANAQTSDNPLASANWPTWCACIWLAGVLVFSIRTLGGWIVLARFRRKGTRSFPAQLLEKCRVFERRLGLQRRINYLQSGVIDNPSVAGWLRPLVLMPMSAISGLSSEQLEAVIVHELAHIKRLDGLVNLFQIAAETLLFYHPAIWWTNRVIRNERENCCDDISVQTCGNATEYAKALTLLESARATPCWALSATGGVLKARVMRLLRPQKAVDAIPSTGVAMFGIFCATAILAAAAVAKPGWKPENSNTAPQQTHAAVAPSSPRELDATSAPGNPSEAAPVAPSSPIAAPANATQQSAPAPPPAPSTEPIISSTSDGSYLDELKSAGLKDLTVEEIISLKIQGVTPEYIQAMRRDGFDPTIRDLIAMKVQGVSPEYVRDIRATGLNPTMRDLVSMKVQGISPEYVRDMKAAGMNPSVHDLVGMKVQGVTPEYARAMKGVGSEPIAPHDLISMKVQGIDPEYVRAIEATGLNPSLHELISMKVQDVTPEYIRTLKSAGLTDLRVHDYIRAKAQGVTPEFIAKVHSHGFQNLTLHQLIELKNADVF